MRGGPDVSFGEVWNILASLAVRRRWLRQASGCRSFFLSPSILGNDNVLYYSLFESATPQWVFECFGPTGVFKPREAVGLVNTRRVLGSTFQYPSRQLRAGRPKFWHN